MVGSGIACGWEGAKGSPRGVTPRVQLRGARLPQNPVLRHRQVKGHRGTVQGVGEAPSRGSERAAAAGRASEARGPLGVEGGGGPLEHGPPPTGGARPGEYNLGGSFSQRSPWVGNLNAAEPELNWKQKSLSLYILEERNSIKRDFSSFKGSGLSLGAIRPPEPRAFMSRVIPARDTMPTTGNQCAAGPVRKCRIN